MKSKKLFIFLILIFQAATTYANQELLETSIQNCQERIDDLSERVGKDKNYRRVGNIALGAGVTLSSTAVSLGVGLFGGVPAMIETEIFTSSTVAGVGVLSGVVIRLLNNKSDLEALMTLLQSTQRVNAVAFDLLDKQYGSTVAQYLSSCAEVASSKQCLEVVENIESRLTEGTLCTNEYSEIDEVLN